MRKLLFLFILLTPLFLSANDSTSVDSTKIHSVRKAVILSAVVPGAGQVYNHMAMPKGKKKAFWKVPLIYAGLGAAGYFLVSNQQQQLSLRREYEFREEYGFRSDPNWIAYDDFGVLTLYNQYLNWRDLSILAVGAVYLLQLADAGVEAHFVSFDVSEDLSISLEPRLLQASAPGIGVSLNFR